MHLGRSLWRNGSYLARAVFFGGPLQNVPIWPLGNFENSINIPVGKVQEPLLMKAALHFQKRLPFVISQLVIKGCWKDNYHKREREREIVDKIRSIAAFKGCLKEKEARSSCPEWQKTWFWTLILVKIIK